MAEPMEPKKRRWTFWKVVLSLFAFVWAFVLLVLVAAGGVFFLIHEHVTREGTAGAAVEFKVPAGASAQQVGVLLAEAELLEHEGFFRLALKVDKSPAPIQRGIYTLHQGLSAAQLLERLQAGPDRHENMNQYKLVVPEGLAIGQMAALFEDTAGFLAAARDRALIAKLGVEAETLEGFLMPNTYFFDAPPTPREAVARMVGQFELEYAKLMEEIPGGAAQDKLSMVTVASLVEEEARAEEERALVSAVMYNRIEKKMRLQMDAALAYLTGKFGQRILDEDKEVDSPYNTYLYAGFPPGPISNPGVASLRAALAPAEVDYLYFVSNADGRTHTFSRTAREHERAVAKYRRDIAAQRRAERQ